MNHTVVRTNVNARYVDPDIEQDKYVEIFMNKNLGARYVTVTATGDNCLMAVGEHTSSNLCQDPLTITNNFFTNPKEIAITLGDVSHSHSQKAGLTTIIVGVCPTQSTQNCIYKTQPVHILPAAADNIEIIAANSVIRGGQLPILVRARDRFNNNLGIGLDGYNIQTPIGELSDGNAFVDQIEFFDFSKSQFVYQAPD